MARRALIPSALLLLSGPSHSHLHPGRPAALSQANKARRFWNPGFHTSLSASQSLSLYSRVPLLRHVIHCSKLPTLLPKWVQPSRTLPQAPPSPQVSSLFVAYSSATDAEAPRSSLVSPHNSGVYLF